MIARDKVEYKGVEYPFITIDREDLDEVGFEPFFTEITLADIELWDAIEKDYMNDGDELWKRCAERIDNNIYFYCDDKFIANNPTDEEVLKFVELEFC